MKTSSFQFLKLNEHEDWRWDSEFICDQPFYNKELLYKPIGHILIYSQYGISIDMNEFGDGCKIYRMNEISNMFCDRYINKHAKITQNQINSFKLKNNDVLFNRTNSQDYVGRTGIFKKFSDENIVFASYLIRVRTNENEVLPEYLTAFLNTKYGIQDAKRRARISINQSNINAEELKRIKIPILKIQIQENIRNIFNLAFDFVNKSELLYKEAEHMLLNELGILNWKPKHSLSFIKSFYDTKLCGRIDSEYFQPMYEEIVNKIQNYRNGYKLFGNIINVKDKNFTPKEDLNYKYIELANISENGDVNGYIKAKGKELPSRARRKVNTGDVIVSSIEGSLSSIALITDDLDNALCSTGFYVINSDKINSQTLLVLLKSIIGQLQLKKGCSGTILTAINSDELEKIVLPNIPDSVQGAIKGKISEKYSMKAMSKCLIDIAKQGVEIAIEKNEKEAENWLKKQTNEMDLAL